MAPARTAPEVAASSPGIVLETPRLLLRRFTVDDAVFIRALLNDPSWLRFIGDKGVRTVEDARNYLLKGPLAMYERVGFGLYLIERTADRVPIGMCGLIKREGIEDVDIGYALMPDFRGAGYAIEAASAVMAYGKERLGIARIVAITSADNLASIKLCEALGMRFERMVRLPNEEVDIKLFA